MARPLRQQFTYVTTLAAIPVFGMIALASWLTYREQRHQLEQETTTTAVTVVAYLNRTLGAADGTALALGQHPAVRTLDAAALGAVLPRITTSQLLDNLAVAAPGGDVVAWSRPPQATVEGALPPGFFRDVAAANQPKVSALLGPPGSDRHGIVLAYPVSDGGAVHAVLGLLIRTEAVEAVLSGIPLPEGSVVTITDGRSVVVARSRDSVQFVGRATEAPGESRDVADVPGSATLTGIDGVERVFGNSVVARGPWLVSVGIPTQVAWERTVPIYQRNYLVSMTVLLMAAAGIFGIARRYIRAFDHFEHAAKRVAAGDLTTLARRPMPAQELEELEATFADMVEKLRRAHDAIESQIADERRMRQELESLQRQVIRQERLAAIGVLVSGVAHELNNPLQAILGFAELLQIKHDLPPGAKADLGVIQRESSRASAIIRNLSRFGRQQTPDATPVHPRDLIASVVELRHRKLLEQGIELDVEERTNAAVLAVFTELQQVLLNFVINAEQAVMTRGDEDRRIMIRSREADGRVRIEVEDSGSGVPPEHEPKLFQPFFTTKPVGEGTGLGLSVSYGIIESYAGTIGYTRSPAGGAIFFFELPVIADVATV